MQINQEIAEKLLEIADLLEEQGASPFRVNAYRRAAGTLDGLDEPVTGIVQREGLEGLIALPGIGEGIARSIYEYVATGHISRLENLQGGRDPQALFEQIPGIGPKLAQRIIDTLHINSLEALEVAAYNERLQTVRGFSAKKVAMVQAWLAQVLGRRQPQRVPHAPVAEPPVSLLLHIDRIYRDKAEANALPTIAPKRFNPEGEAWLPILHITKEGWHFTALYSNTARAHQLRRTRDWVVIYFYDDRHHESQHTVVTETRGSLIGRRVVRGREAECLDHYAELEHGKRA